MTPADPYAPAQFAGVDAAPLDYLGSALLFAFVLALIVTALARRP